MLVFYFRGHAFVVYLQTIKVHNDSVFKELTVHFLLQKSHLWNPPCLWISKRKYLPMPSEFHNREPPLPFGNQKRRPSYRYGYFLESPTFFTCGILMMCLLSNKDVSSTFNMERFYKRQGHATSKHIFAPNGGYCVDYPSNIFCNMHSFKTLGIFLDSPQF